RTAMISNQGSDLVLTFARTLFANGQATDQTVDAAERLGEALGSRVKVTARWGELQLQSDSKDAATISQIAADPSGGGMDRVASTMRAIEDVQSGRLTPAAAMQAISVIARAPPAPTWLFALAAAAGAVSLSVIFGVDHFAAMALIFVSAGAGAFLRRAVARWRENNFIQPFCAAILALVIRSLPLPCALPSSFH